MEVDVKQLLNMHSDNANRANQQDTRMLSIESEQKKQNETLSDIKTVLARIDERTQGYKNLEENVQQARGASKVALIVAGSGILGELAKVLFGQK